MLTTTPVEADAFRMLRDNLYQHLEEAEFLAEQHGDVIRAVITDLADVIRDLIAQHDVPRVAAVRQCDACRTAWPCPGFHAIYRVVKDPNRQLVKLLNARRP